MKYNLERATLSSIKADAIVLGVFQGESIKDILHHVDDSFPSQFAGAISQLASDDGFKGKAQQIMSLPTYGQIPAKKLFLVGLGPPTAFSANLSRKAAANLGRRLTNNAGCESLSFFLRMDALTRPPRSGSKSAKGTARGSGKAAKTTSVPLDRSQTSQLVQAIVEGLILGSYSFSKYKSDKSAEKKAGLQNISFAGITIANRDFAQACDAGEAIADATNFARALIAEPACYMTPSRLAGEAKRICRELDLTCKIMEAEQMEKLGMGALLGVAQGAKEPPRFVVMKYEHAQSKKTVALVGKGITFDSGGLSLKNAQSMEHMKYDMSGAAAVIGVMQVVGTLKPKLSVTGIIPCTENMPGGAALHPGDVIKALNGKTIEVNNTDAEGRLVLADAISYAVKDGADEIIDIATLTGAIVTALGRVAAGVMGSDQALIDSLIASADRAGEKLWQMPLFDEYKESLKSDIADLKNAGSRGEAASSAAAMFLKEFVDGKPWAHLDIAGPGWLERERDENNKGGTAFGVRTLSHYIMTLQDKKKP